MNQRETGFQSAISIHIERFIAYKRALGRRYDVEEITLRLLDRALVEEGIQESCDITPELIERFLASRPRVRPRSYNHLLCTVRRLFDWMVTQEVLEWSPVRVHPKRRTSQRSPFIFDIHSAKQLLNVARRLPERSNAPMRGVTYHAIFATLFGLGLRVGEVCRLKIEDVDFSRKLLVIQKTKFYKSRFVPFGPKLEALLREYLQIRNAKIGTAPLDAPFFSFTQRGEIHPCTVSQTFHRLVPLLKLDIPLGCSPPRLHDLRHSFAVGTLTRWYRSGINPGTELLKLSTFLGHVDINSTGVYLTMTPALLQEANQRFERFTAPLITEEVNQ
jgi:site-specific recombinase XerD